MGLGVCRGDVPFPDRDAGRLGGGGLVLGDADLCGVGSGFVLGLAARAARAGGGLLEVGLDSF